MNDVALTAARLAQVSDIMSALREIQTKSKADEALVPGILARNNRDEIFAFLAAQNAQLKKIDFIEAGLVAIMSASSAEFTDGAWLNYGRAENAIADVATMAAEAAKSGLPSTARALNDLHASMVKISQRMARDIEQAG